MAAANTDKVLKVGVPGTATTLAAPGHAIAGTTINVVSTTNWSTDTAVAFAMDQVQIVDGEEERIPGTYTEWVGVVASGTSINQLVLAYGTDQVYPAGSLTRVYIPVTSTQVNRFADAFLAQHKQNGSHGAVTADSVSAPVGTFTSLVITGNPTSEGWTPISGTPTVVTGYNKGQKEHEITYAAADLTAVLYPGYKIKIPRSVTPPTQCADFESSSSQYAGKVSPTGISFTDDFTIEAWVNIESYTGATQSIASRYSSGPDDGFSLEITSSGQISLYAAGTGNRAVVSYQSVPTGVWVHIAASIDMSAGTTALYLNGVLIPSILSGAATSFTQAGDLQIGRTAALSSFFDGKIADVRIWSAIRTATQIRDNMNFQLVGNETNLVSYFKLNGNFTDSTANANTLTGSGGAVATSVDNPMKSTEYGFITKVTKPSADTIVTVYTGTDHNIPLQTLSAASYSQARAPQGFPAGRNKWAITMLASAQYNRGVSGNSSFDMNFPTAVPIGDWIASAKGVAYADYGSTTTLAMNVLISPTSAETDLTIPFSTYGVLPSITNNYTFTFAIPRVPISLAAQTIYYLSIFNRVGINLTSLALLNGQSPLTVTFECAYA